MKSVSLKQRLVGKKSLKKNWMQKESVSKQGRKSAKAKPSVHKDPLFDELPDDTLDYMDTEDAQDVGRTRDVVNEEKETADGKVSTEDALSTAQQKVSTDRPNVSADRLKFNTDKEKDSTISPDEGTDDQTERRSATPTTPTTTPTMFGDDETIAQVLLNMSQAKAVSREKEKGVELKDVEETERPRPTSTRSLLTLKPLPKIDPKDKGKKKIEEEDESDTKSEGIPKAEKKFKQLARDEEMARKVQEYWEAEEEVKKLAEEEAIKDVLSNEYDFIQARMEAYRLLALRLQDEEREKFTVFDESFTAVGSTEDERRIKEMNKGVKDPDQKSLKKRVVEETPKKEDTAKVPAKVDVIEQGTMDNEIMERKYVIARLNKVISPDGDYLVIFRANGNFRAFNCLLEGDLKIMMESSQEENDQSDFWDDQQDWEIVTWRLYESCVAYILELKDGTVIHMLVERRYPFYKDLLQRMLDLGLEVERESTAALDLIRFIKQQSWLVQDQTVLGKDYSNLLIADSLLKTIWFINAPCYGNKALAIPKANELTIPEQTATGKRKSNPFMAGSLPKTTKPT
ncbi:hypothetical protein Tco_0906523 [Tanacetum coccineum]|uniref:Uncharacterized protein n=1 Tax=Tanacetum coccineum TaxID=301880 RepID=A0ABQ5CJY2_9ASTR